MDHSTQKRPDMIDVLIRNLKDNYKGLSENFPLDAPPAMKKSFLLMAETLENLTREYARQKSAHLTFQDYHQKILGSVADMIIILDEKGRITDSNPALFNNLGYLGPEINGKSIDDLMDKKISKTLLEEMYYGPEEHSIISKKGEVIPCLITSNIIHLQNKKNGHVCVVQNIKEKKKQAELINIQRLQLMEASKMSALGEMSAGVAHEINNPLAIIAANLKLIRKLLDQEFLDRKKISLFLTEMEETVSRIVKIIMSLRTVSRRGEGQKFVRENMETVIHEVTVLFQERIKGIGIKLEKTFLPQEGEQEILVDCNRVQLAQVLINLLNNAFDAIVPLPERWVRIHCRDLGKKVEISITDSGKGLPEKIRDNMFQPFFTTKDIGKGTGLGLSLSRKIIEEHNGELTLDKNSSHTRFLIIIPKSKHPTRI